MTIFEQIKNFFIKPDKVVNGVKLFSVNNYSGGYYYDGNYYNSDIVRSCIKPFYRAIGKLSPKQLKRNAKGEITGKTDLYLTELLRRPNPYMSMSSLLEKTAITLQLNSNAFIYTVKNNYGLTTALYPIPAYSAEKEYGENGELFLKFHLKNGDLKVLRYADIIHIRKDFTDNDDIFGESPAESLKDLMEVVKSSDKSVINAVKNGGVIKWILSFAQSLKPKDLKERARAFEEDYLSGADGGSIVAAQDNTQKVEQIKPTDYVPNASLQDRAKERLYAFFGVNENIIQSKFSEDEWQAYFESEIEPIARQLSEEFTNKVLRDFETIGGKNEIVFDSTSLQFASMTSKLNLLQMVDRGALTPNEWRKTLNLPPIENGDKAIRRLDTATVTDFQEKK